MERGGSALEDGWAGVVLFLAGCGWAELVVVGRLVEVAFLGGGGGGC